MAPTAVLRATRCSATALLASQWRPTSRFQLRCVLSRAGVVTSCAGVPALTASRSHDCVFVLQVKGGVSDQLMDWLVTLVEKADVPDGATMGFTFSFPVDQTAIDAGTLMHWTKGWTTRGVPGQDVMALLRERLQRRVRHALCRPLSPVGASLHPALLVDG